MSSAARLESVDVLRGLTVIGMIVVNAAAGLQRYRVPAPFLHAHWIGLTLADLVFPAFIFVMGVSIALSMPASAGLNKDAALRIAARSLRLIALGLLLTNLYWLIDYDTYHFRVPGVLQRIGLVFLFAAPLHLLCTTRQLFWTALLLLIGYSLACLLPFPGGVTDLHVAGANIAGWIDRAVLGTHIYVQGPLGYDPEGLLSTVPAIAQALLGIVAGRQLLNGSTRTLATAGAVSIVAGAALAWIIPISKDLWSASFVLVTSGLTVMLLGVLRHGVDLRGWRLPGAIVCAAFGINAIAAYVLHYLLSGMLGWKSMDALYAAAANVLGPTLALFFPIGVFVALIAWLMLALQRRRWVVKI